ncbi:hypothetical protein E4U56_002274 [Claviceps arundinis]|uniref:Uncharacterized protein n=1 Tax=Claviceps arundinis TaxID=1623583 RepID=A0A9P7MRC1_9HYPO|nr:hypothetical protein E4U56_002274 [Claviceps arundinis]
MDSEDIGFENIDSSGQPTPTKKISKRKLAAQQKGDNFELVKLPSRKPTISQLPDDPVALFHRFCPEHLVERWVSWTNSRAAHRLSNATMRLAHKL